MAAEMGIQLSVFMKGFNQKQVLSINPSQMPLRRMGMTVHVVFHWHELEGQDQSGKLDCRETGNPSSLPITFRGSCALRLVLAGASLC